MITLNATSINDLGRVARAIGGDEGRDFSFLVNIAHNGQVKLMKATAQHVEENGRVIADVRPARFYGK